MIELEQTGLKWIREKKESRHSQERNQMVQNMYDESIRRQSEDAIRSQEMTAAINRGIRNARKDESSDITGTFMDRHRRLLDKGREGIKRQQDKTYFS